MKNKSFLLNFLVFCSGAAAYNLYALVNFRNHNLSDQIECSMVYNVCTVKEAYYRNYLDYQKYNLELCKDEIESYRGEQE
jgi:hypothetical protein